MTSLQVTSIRPALLDRIGNTVPAGATTEAILDAAKLNWTVNLETLYLQSSDGSLVETSIRAIARESDSHVFGPATPTYQVVQNAEVVDTIRALHEQADGRDFNVGFFGQGERCFTQFRVGEDYKVAGIDPVRRNIFGSWGHDGGTGINFDAIAFRIICANTFARAVADKSAKRVSLRHTRSATERVAEARYAFGLISKAFDAQFAAFEQLAQAKADEELQQKVLNVIAPVASPGAAEKAREAAQQVRLAVWKSLTESPTVKAAGGITNRWGLLNGASEWVEHLEGRKGQNATSDNPDKWERRALYTIEGNGLLREQAVFSVLTRDLVLA